MMKSFAKLPLYLGLAVLVFSVLISVIKIGNQQAFTSQRTRANVSGASLVLKYTAPDLVSIILTSDKEVSGVDITVKFNGDKIKILPSSLTSGPLFITSGGTVNDKSNVFAFSAITKNTPVAAAVVATFNVLPKEGLNTAEADIQFENVGTTVIAKDSGQNILTNTQGVKFTVSSK